MANHNAVPTRRKRGKKKLNTPVWTYFDPDEHEIIDQAANLERRSKSSFVADAALDKANSILRKEGHYSEILRPLSPSEIKKELPRWRPLDGKIEGEFACTSVSALEKLRARVSKIEKERDYKCHEIRTTHDNRLSVLLLSRAVNGITSQEIEIARAIERVATLTVRR